MKLIWEHEPGILILIANLRQNVCLACFAKRWVSVCGVVFFFAFSFTPGHMVDNQEEKKLKPFSS